MIRNALIDIGAATVMLICLPYDFARHLRQALVYTWLDARTCWDSRTEYKRVRAKYEPSGPRR